MAYNKPGYFLKTRSIFRISAQICLFVIFRIVSFFGKAYEFQNFCKFFSLCIVFAKKAGPHFFDHRLEAFNDLVSYAPRECRIPRKLCNSATVIVQNSVCLGYIYNWRNDFTKQTYKIYFWNQLSCQFDGSRGDRHTTYRFQKLENLGDNNFMHKFFEWND